MADRASQKRASPKGPGFSIAEFARLDDVDSSPAVIRTAVRKGDIRAVKFNGKLRIPPAERDRYLATWGERGTSTQR